MAALDARVLLENQACPDRMEEKDPEAPWALKVGLGAKQAFIVRDFLCSSSTFLILKTF